MNEQDREAAQELRRRIVVEYEKAKGLWLQEVRVVSTG